MIDTITIQDRWAARFMTPNKPLWYTVWKEKDNGETLMYISTALLTLEQAIKLKVMGYECFPK